jgi:integrase
VACIRERRNRLVIDFYDQHGKRRWKTLKKGTTQRDARKVLREIEESIEKGSYLAPTDVPAFSRVADAWLKIKKPNIRHSTYKQYAGHVENHLKPYFGNTPINRVNNYDSVERYVKHCQDEGMSTAMLKKTLVTLGGIFTYACRKRYIAYNPVRDIEKPKGRSTTEEAKDITILTPEQIRALIDAAPDLKSKTLFMTAIGTGMRQGELLGSEWDDLDWVSGQIQVKRTFNYKRFYEPKSKTSRRKIDLAPQLIAQLKEWQLACPPNKLGLIFPNEDGNPMNDSNLRSRIFDPALKKAKIPKIRFHDLRHCYASLLIEQGESPKYIQNQMGHSSINVTFDIYGHLMKDSNQEAASRLGNTIFGESGSKSVAFEKERT